MENGLGRLLFRRVELPVGQLLAAWPHVLCQLPTGDDVPANLLTRLVRQLVKFADR